MPLPPGHIPSQANHPVPERSKDLIEHPEPKGKDRLGKDVTHSLPNKQPALHGKSRPSDAKKLGKMDHIKKLPEAKPMVYPEDVDDAAFLFSDDELDKVTDALESDLEDTSDKELESLFPDEEFPDIQDVDKGVLTYLFDTLSHFSMASLEAISPYLDGKINSRQSTATVVSKILADKAFSTLKRVALCYLLGTDIAKKQLNFSNNHQATQLVFSVISILIAQYEQLDDSDELSRKEVVIDHVQIGNQSINNIKAVLKTTPDGAIEIESLTFNSGPEGQPADTASKALSVSVKNLVLGFQFNDNTPSLTSMVASILKSSNVDNGKMLFEHALPRMVTFDIGELSLKEKQAGLDDGEAT
ncbi:hypothetical protein [Endozoicomonas sp.]|uniref:hypothetical protein n=1 Tax=Endozoicomonas sp. TaxID=1892382 RepID=UPI003AF99F61